MPVQPENALLPMEVMFDPKVYLVTWLPNLFLRLSDSEYEAEAMALLLMVTESRRLHPSNAYAPMEFTELGMVTEVSFEQYSKACEPIEYTVAGINGFRLLQR